MANPNEVFDLLRGSSAFDHTKLRSSLLALFGDERGVSKWIYDLAMDIETSPATKARCADVILEILSPAKGESLNVDILSDDEIERVANRMLKE